MWNLTYEANCVIGRFAAEPGDGTELEETPLGYVLMDRRANKWLVSISPDGEVRDLRHLHIDHEAREQ